ncbi:MAG: 3-deoxy-D-manno-octulosonic acid transferase [Pseudomonadota bacterium]
MKPFAISAYLALTSRADRWAERTLEKRLAKGKEDSERLPERRGEASLPRPENAFLIWFHAASVGESLSLLEVINRLAKNDKSLHFLITTGTVTSAETLAARMPPSTVHQYVPLDTKTFVTKFLDHWRPNLAVWTESELWPTLILETAARGTPVALLNARLSDKSAKRWQRLGKSAKYLFSQFAAVQVQDDTTAAHLRRLGVPPDAFAVTGTLKEGTPPLPCDERELSHVVNILAGNPVWCAASTHPGEEEIVLKAHALARATLPDLALILVPRHPERSGDIYSLAQRAGFNVQRRSDGADFQKGVELYLADTMGELGLWYRLASVSFVGGSLVDMGGHNPYEPAALGSVILHGPHTRNFQDIYARLLAHGASAKVTSAEELAQAVQQNLDPNISGPMAQTAWELSSSGADVTDKALAMVEKFLPKARND